MDYSTFPELELTTEIIGKNSERGDSLETLFINNELLIRISQYGSNYDSYGDRLKIRLDGINTETNSLDYKGQFYLENSHYNNYASKIVELYKINDNYVILHIS